MANDPILTTAAALDEAIEWAVHVPCPTHRMNDCSQLYRECPWTPMINRQVEGVIAEVLPTVEAIKALRDGIREWAEAKYPDRHGRAVTMPESDARLIALLGEGNDGK